MMHEPLPTLEEQIRFVARDEATRVARDEAKLAARVEMNVLHAREKKRQLWALLFALAAGALVASIVTLALMTAPAEGASLTVSATVVGPCGTQPCPDYREAPPPAKPEE